MTDGKDNEEATAQQMSSTIGGSRGGRILRRTFLVSLLLVSVGLIASSALELFFRYRENVETLGELQQQTAQGAAFKIHQFVQEIEKTMRASTQNQEIVTAGLTQNYRFELIKLLKVAPAITETVAVSADGREEIKVSRVRTTLSDDLTSRPTDEAFKRARGGKAFLGSVYFVRKSEPYMTIAIPIERFAGEAIGVLISEVNLKYIWDVVSAIKVGKAGYAYVVSGDGDLIAHPDISYVLEKRNLKELRQVKTALANTPGHLSAETSLIGQKVFAAFAPVADLGWAVLVERPVTEAYAPLYASTLRTSLLLLVGLGMAFLASFLIGKKVVRPIEILRQGAARIGSGDLDHRLDINTGDELQALADEFNKMTEQLQDSYANLEQKVEDRTKELSESLEQQTATSEILRVISSSPTDIQPVLDAIAENAARVCGAEDVLIWRVEGNSIRLVAKCGSVPSGDIGHESPLARGTVAGRAVVDRQMIHIHDLEAVEADYPDAKTGGLKWGVRSVLATPLLREGIPIGVIQFRRLEVRPFSEKQIALLKTFADQAVIAIENVRLFQELQARTQELARSVGELTALGEVGQAVSSTLDLETVLTTIVTQAVQLSGTHGGVVYEYDEAAEEFHLRATHRLEKEMIEALQGNPIRLGEGAVGKAVAIRAPVQIPDALTDPEYALTRLRPILAGTGHRSILAVPLLREQQIIGGLVVLRKEAGGFSTEAVNLLQTFAAQSVLAIQNAKLFREIEDKSQQLETANRHKSQFLANVSHELRTPLNSIIGFTRLVLRRTEGMIPALQKENLQKVVISSEHLLNLINGLLDLSKIESGRMEVFAETFKLEEVIRVATATVEPMLKDGRVRLVTEIAPDIPPVKTDRDKLKQVIINLLGNSVKFTEKGEIRVSAWRDDGMFKLAVSDTGIGMKKEALDYIFEEFRQVDMSTTRKYGGTGLGLAIVKRLVNLLGGEIEVESAEGKGSKFTITLPISMASR